MAFDPRDFRIEDWLDLEHKNLLQKICNVYDSSGFLVEQYKTRVTVFPVGTFRRGIAVISAPSLYREFHYNDNGSRYSSLPEVREWTQACEDASQGFDPVTPGDDGGVSIPFGISVVGTTYEYNAVSNIPVGVPQVVINRTLGTGESIFLRHVKVGGENRASWDL